MTKSNLTLENLFRRGTEAHQKGDLSEAERCYKKLLAVQRNHFDALHLFGVIRLQRGHYAEAEQLIRKAVDINPRFAPARFNHGISLAALKRFDDALAAYDAALALNYNTAEVFSSRAVALQGLGRLDEALTNCEQALAIKRDYVDALNNRGNVLQDLERLDDALKSYDMALAIASGSLEALYNRANALQRLQRFDAALASFDAALAIMPGHVAALTDRGNVLRELGRAADAIADYNAALAIDESYPKALYNRANLLMDLNDHGAAAEDLRRLLKISDDFPYALGNLYYCLLNCCRWESYLEIRDAIRSRVLKNQHAATPFTFLFVSDSPSDQLASASLFYRDKYERELANEPARGKSTHDRIRLAYLSSDFHSHATSYLIAELLELHDRTRFETMAVSFGPDENSEIRARLKNACDHFVDVREKADPEIVSLLREKGIDIAVDLKGYTGGSRFGIFSHRAAPLQVSYLGYPGTTGSTCIDYILADEVVLPKLSSEFYSEKVVYLPDCYQVNDSKRRIADTPLTRADAGLKDGAFVFCCFNGHYKITPEVFDIWMRLLGKVEGSVLWLIEGSAASTRNLQREAERRGIAAGRLVFAPKRPLDLHLARHGLADLFLDTLPVNAHTTASDALWAGLPVLTCVGQTFAARVAGSLLAAIGLPELITESLRAYEALAFKLAREPEALQAIRAKLANNRRTHPLFDSRRYARHIETAYTTMVERYRCGKQPEGFSVMPIGVQ